MTLQHVSMIQAGVGVAGLEMEMMVSGEQVRLSVWQTEL